MDAALEVFGFGYREAKKKTGEREHREDARIELLDERRNLRTASSRS